MANRNPWPWPDELDAVIAAPQYHRLVFENDQVRVLDTHIPVGATTPVHTHRWPAVYYTLSFSHYVRRDGKGNVLMDSRQLPGTLPSAVWLECLPPHSVENVGEVEIHLISFELKGAA
jgi:hypothetical protein